MRSMRRKKAQESQGNWGDVPHWEPRMIVAMLNKRLVCRGQGKGSIEEVKVAKAKEAESQEEEKKQLGQSKRSQSAKRPMLVLPDNND